MIQLKQLLSEILNTYSVEGYLLHDPKEPVSLILSQIRALEKVTIVDNITPDDFIQKPTIIYTKFKIKFITRTNNPKQDVENLRKRILTTKDEDLRIPGVKTVKFNLDTLKRI